MLGPLAKEPWHLLQSQISGSPAISRLASFQEASPGRGPFSTGSTAHTRAVSPARPLAGQASPPFWALAQPVGELLSGPWRM